MFFEDLESRQMYSITLSAHALTPVDNHKHKVPADLIVSAAPSQKTPKKPASSIIAAELQDAANKFKDAKNLPKGGTVLLPGGLVLSLDPTRRVSKDDLIALNTMSQLLGQELQSSELKSLLSQYGKSLSKMMGDLSSGADPTSKPDLSHQLDAFMADFKANTDFARGDSQSKYADGGLLIDLSYDEIQAAKAGKTKTSDKADKTEHKPTTGEQIAEGAKEAGEAVVELFIEVIVHLSKLPGADLIEGPKILEKSHLHGDDLANGSAAVGGQSGDKDPRMPHGRGLSDPNSDDVKLDPAAQRSIERLWAAIRGPKSSPTFHDLGTTLISMPARDGDGSFVHKPDRDSIKKDGKPRHDLSTIINTLGDDGTGNTAGGSVVPPKVPGVKDPAGPSSGVDPTSGHPGTPSPGNGGSKPTNPR